MSPSVLYRLSGVSLLTGGLLGTLAVAFHPASMTDPASVPVHLALYSAVMLAALGLPGFYARQAQQSGKLGFAGFVLLFLGLVFTDPIHSVLEFTVIPVLAADPATQPILQGPPPGLMGPLMIAIPVLLIGLALEAVAIVRAGVYWRWLAVPAFATLVLVVVGFLTSPSGEGSSPLGNIGPAMLYLTLAAFGSALVSLPVRVAQRATAASPQLRAA